MDTEEDYDSGNKANSKPEPARYDDFEYEIKSLVISFNSLDVTDTIDEVGKWVNNKTLYFAHVPIIASIPSLLHKYRGR